MCQRSVSKLEEALPCWDTHGFSCFSFTWSWLTSVLFSMGLAWSVLSSGWWWVKKDVVLVSPKRFTVMTLIFFKAFRTPSCVTDTGMWSNLFSSSFQFLIISNNNRISCSRFQNCKKPCRPCEKRCFLALRRNLRQSFPRSVFFGHGTNVQTYRPGDQS